MDSDFPKGLPIPVIVSGRTMSVAAYTVYINHPVLEACPSPVP